MYLKSRIREYSVWLFISQMAAMAVVGLGKLKLLLGLLHRWWDPDTWAVFCSFPRHLPPFHLLLPLSLSPMIFFTYILLYIIFQNKGRWLIKRFPFANEIKKLYMVVSLPYTHQPQNKQCTIATTTLEKLTFLKAYFSIMEPWLVAGWG